MRKNIRKSQGFTLIELMIITAIIGVLSAIAIPYYRTYLLESRTAAMLATADTIQKVIAIKASRGEIEIGTKASWEDLDYPTDGPKATANISEFTLGDSNVLTLTLSKNFSSSLNNTLITLTPELEGLYNIVWSVDVGASATDDGGVVLEYIQNNFDEDAT